jgi:hypothetical protein
VSHANLVNSLMTLDSSLASHVEQALINHSQDVRDVKTVPQVRPLLLPGKPHADYA